MRSALTWALLWLYVPAWILLTCAQVYIEPGESVLYNDTSDFLAAYYGYDTSPFAAEMSDPYDATKSWSVNVERESGEPGDKDEEDEVCENGQCSKSQGKDGSAAEVKVNDQRRTTDDLVDMDALNPLYIYDNCDLNEDGDVHINGTRDCNIVIRGIDASIDLLRGGVDGLYQIQGCFEGKPMYRRVDSLEGEERILFYHPYMGDWELCIGDEPNDDNLVMYGDFGQVSPLDVLQWHVSAAFSSILSQNLKSGDEDLYFVAPESSLSCSGEESTDKAGGMGRDSTSGISYHRHSTTMRLKPDEEGPFEEEDGLSELGKDEMVEVEEYEDGKEDNNGETVI